MVIHHCIRNCCVELDPFQSWFGVEEFSPKRTLDVPASFTPTGIWVILAKLVCLGYIISTQVLNVVETKQSSLWFYAAYYTHWALAFACLYGMVSVLNSLFPVAQLTGTTRVPLRIRLTWLLFATVLQAQFITTIVYWTLVFDGGTPDYMEIAPHGPVFLAVLIDGCHINRIPLRWMHLWLGEITIILFAIWSIIHGPLVLDLGKYIVRAMMNIHCKRSILISFVLSLFVYSSLGNPNQSSDDGDPDDNDDAIYASLSWKQDDIFYTVIMLVVILGVVDPVLFSILRAYSRSWLLPCCGGDRRRYVDHEEEDDQGRKQPGKEVDPDEAPHEQYGVDEENPYFVQEPEN